MKALALAFSVVMLAGCTSENARPTTTRDVPAGAPDAGKVTVPDDDDSPPTVTVALAAPRGGRTLAEASQPPGREPAPAVELPELRLGGTTLGTDPNGGVARVRVSISERIACGSTDGRRFERLHRRYFPPPQIERIRVAPGTRLPTRRRRSLELSLGAGCGPGAHAVEVHGQLWGEAINGHGLEAVTPHIRFSYRRR
jgi:hypothetical protein